MTDSVIVSYVENEDPEKTLLVVGKKRINQSVKIINAFSGDEAIELYNKLITNKENTK